MSKNNIKYMTFSTVVTYTSKDNTTNNKKKLVVVYYEENDPAFIGLAVGDPFESEPTIDIQPFREDFERVFNGEGNFLPDDEVSDLDVIVSRDEKGNIWFDYKGGNWNIGVKFSITPRQSKKLVKIMQKVYPFDDYMDKEPEDFE